MRTGAILAEMLICLVLITILVLFSFDAIVNSLNIANKQELEIKTISLLNFVQSYLAEYRVGTILPDASTLIQQINSTFHGGSNEAFPRISSLEASTVNLFIPPSTVTYRTVRVKIEKSPRESEYFLFFFGL